MILCGIALLTGFFMVYSLFWKRLKKEQRHEVEKERKELEKQWKEFLEKEGEDFRQAKPQEWQKRP